MLSLNRRGYSPNRSFLPGRNRAIVLKACNAVMDNMIDGLIVLDRQNLLLELNSSAERVFRISRSKVIGKPAESIFAMHQEVLDNLKYDVRKKQSLAVKIDGEACYYLLDINPLMDKRGAVTGKVLVFQDITSLKLSEIKLQEARARAERAEHLKSAFLANMSHEIRTPMNAIIGFSNLLNDAAVTEEERHEFIGHIRNSGNSLLQLIDDIIDISKLDAGQVQQENRRMSVTRLMTELFSFFNENLQESDKQNIQLLVSGISGHTDWIVMADGAKLNRIMRHLLANAVKFTSSGFIEFGVKMENPGELLFYVQDTGIGIAQEKQGMIFERFSRIMTGTRQEYGGTGLGLAICKGMVELMGGRIWVKSGLGAGSTFYLSLPVSQVEEHHEPVQLSDIYTGVPLTERLPEIPMPVGPGLIAESVEAGGMVRTESWKEKLVLVMETDELVYLNIEMILRQTRINVAWVRSMNEAARFLERNNRIDAVILSAMMSDSTPEDSMSFLRQAAPEIGVICIVPVDSPQMARSCKELGCRTTLSKPISPSDLLGALGPILS